LINLSKTTLKSLVLALCRIPARPDAEANQRFKQRKENILAAKKST